MDKPYLSIIVPVYNEQERIKNLLQIYDFFKKEKLAFEILVVNDGSSDDTSKILNDLKKTLNINIIEYTTNRGKGYAVKTGMLKAQGQFRLFMDIDLSTPLTMFHKFKNLLPSSDVLIGTRKLDEVQITKRQPFVREFMGKCFTLLSKIILNLKVSDFTCGFKIFSERAASDIFSRSTIERWGFDSEILFIAQKMKYNITEIPVDWKNDPKTKVKFPQDIIRSFSELLRILTNNLKGKYNIS